MGRPLYSSILLSRQAAEVSASRSDAPKMTPKTEYPVVEKWSRTNAFDPDSDEFFNEENAVYEAFLPEDGVAAQAMADHVQRTRLLSERVLRERIADARTTTSTDERNGTNAEAETNLIQRRTNGLDTDAIDDFVGDIRRGGILRTEPPLTQADAPVPDATETLATAREQSTPSHPVELVFGLRQLSESPRPLDPADFPSHSISPIPDTPARISGVFTATAPPRRRTFTVAPMSWDSPARLELVMPDAGHNIEPRFSSVPASLTS